MKLRIGLVLWIVSASVSAAAAAHTIVPVTGQVVDARGKPVAGAWVADFWFAEQAGRLEPTRPAQTAADGRFALEIDLYGRDVAVMAIDATGKLGGVATVLAKDPERPLRMELAPLVEFRGRYASEKPVHPLEETYVTFSLAAGKLRVAAGRSRESTFALRLPPGRYLLTAGADYRHVDDKRDITLEPGKPLDLGEIKLPLSPIARQFGKQAPAWHVTDARGVPKNVQPADFKGKWVVLEFWGYWCGPCTQRGLPGWFDFADDHVADRDKFAIVTVHDPQATDFAMLDEKLKPIIRRTWHGRSLPFPILLDTSGQMVKDYGVNGWPTAVLLDPAGRVVDFGRKPLVLGSGVCEDFLASKLPALPQSKRIARALDRDLGLGVDEDQSLAELMSFYGKVARITIRLDADELKAAGIDQRLHVPLKAGGRLTLRSWLNLSLDPLGLTYIADGDDLRVVRRTPENLRLSQPSAKQNDENSLVAAALKQKVTFKFEGDSLKQLIAVLETKTDETFVLDPSARRAGAIKPEKTISGSAVDEPLASALSRILAPLGMTYVVRNEAVVLTTAH